jgi:hypothetical protein
MSPCVPPCGHPSNVYAPICYRPSGSLDAREQRPILCRVKYSVSVPVATAQETHTSVCIDVLNMLGGCGWPPTPLFVRYADPNISEFPTPPPYMLHCHYTETINCLERKVDFNRLGAFCPEKTNCRLHFFLCPLAQFARHCSPDAVQPCIVFASEQACHLLAGRIYERTIVTAL